MVWAVDIGGKRVPQRAAHAEGGSVTFEIDNLALGYGPVVYFEIAAK
jgi:hypothetical protein